EICPSLQWIEQQLEEVEHLYKDDEILPSDYCWRKCSRPFGVPAGARATRVQPAAVCLLSPSLACSISVAQRTLAAHARLTVGILARCLAHSPPGSVGCHTTVT
ncbi:hypothetical protein XENOCAPTIV_012051, partial [Xenoophorus captivus]